MTVQLLLLMSQLFGVQSQANFSCLCLFSFAFILLVRWFNLYVTLFTFVFRCMWALPCASCGSCTNHLSGIFCFLRRWVVQWQTGNLELEQPQNTNQQNQTSRNDSKINWNSNQIFSFKNKFFDTFIVFKNCRLSLGNLSWIGIKEV